jgi:OOP family OmpA-OmpF porin
MAIDLLSLAHGYVSSEIVGKVADTLGETPANIGLAFDSAFPVVFAGLIQASATPSGAASLLRTIQQGGYDGHMLDNLGAVFSGDATKRASFVNSGTGLLGSFFSSNLIAVVAAVATNSGIRSSSASTVLGIATPIVLSLLGRQVSSLDLHGSGLMSLLNSQSESVARLLPHGLAAVFRETPARNTGPVESDTADISRSAIPRLWPLILGCLVALGLWYFLRGTSHSSDAAANAPAAFVRR